MSRRRRLNELIILAALAVALCGVRVVFAAAPVGLDSELYDIFGVTRYATEFVDDCTEAIVLVVLDDKCPVVQQSIPALCDLHERYNGFEKDRAGRPTEFAKYPGDRVTFLGVYVKSDMGARRMAAHAAHARVPFRVLHDPQMTLIEHLGLTRLSEAAVLDRSWNVHYTGPVDDANAQGASKPAATERYLADAIDAVLAGRDVEQARRPGRWVARSTSPNLRSAKQSLPTTRTSSRSCSDTASRAIARAKSPRCRC